MQIPFTFSKYIIRTFLGWFFIVFAALVLIITLFDTVELFRRAASKPDVSVLIIIKMVAMKLPYITQQLMPFIILFASLFTFRAFNRNLEFVVARGSGISAWQFLAPIFALVALFSILDLALLNPLTSAMMSRYEKFDARYFKRQSNPLTLSDTGLWVKNSDPDGYHIIHADRVHPDSEKFYNVSVFNFNNADEYRGRIDTSDATIKEDKLKLENVYDSPRHGTTTQQGKRTLESNIKMRAIQESFASPYTLSFWALPGFIRVMEASGFSGLSHRLHWNVLLSYPVILCIMILIAAIFTLRWKRNQRLTFSIAGSVGCGFVFYVFNSVMHTLGLSSKVPISFSVWIPIVCVGLSSLMFLLHLEDS
ncbi:MAG: LPS export ABC transporter permease LptG [Alphaproteobacteria bacterium]|nr:LPS export ABC transporter permease LptG [Alphaproteobacteria bacterium]MBT5389327.1 LPS export ABC transporter permease LptG [Alphaproteobacteria bacterium]MBT5654629.1 LPS export ABC transporter permease LptG [Alphaproteobacteria bacterium]